MTLDEYQWDAPNGTKFSVKRGFGLLASICGYDFEGADADLYEQDITAEILRLAARVKELEAWQERARAFLRDIDHCADDACCPGCYASLVEKHSTACKWVALLQKNPASKEA